MVSTVAEASVPPSPLTTAPAAVRDYVTQRGLETRVKQVVSLAQVVFEVAHPILLAVEDDPDTGETWIEVNVAVRGSVDEVKTAHDAFMERLLRLPTASDARFDYFST